MNGSKTGAGSRTFRVKMSARAASDADLLDDLRRVANVVGGDRLTRDEYGQHGLYHPTTIHRRLGGWTAACAAAGLGNGRPDLGHRDDEWFSNIVDVWQSLGHQPSYGDMRGSRFSPEGYAKRFGTWTAALLRFQDWIDANGDLGPAEPSLRPNRSVSSKRQPNLRERFHVLQRDRFTCRSCGRSPATHPGTVLHVDHVIPFSKGGMTTIENLQTLCSDCNYGKSDVESS